MAASSELQLDHLPSDPLLHVLSYLSFRDLVHADRLQRGLSWYGLFKHYYSDLGRYIQYYVVLKKAWEKLKSFLQQRCPRMIVSLKGNRNRRQLHEETRTLLEPQLTCWVLDSFPDGATEGELDDIEAQIRCKLPDDYRCSYRIHNGQKLVIPGSVCGQCSLPLFDHPSLTSLSLGPQADGQHVPLQPLSL
ncbi:hypothetical protein XENOCAPTIV_012340 [Xenoophorus captivus]|uniref:F-box domain-containing protein n=1 Tax=Xenoophorus captivus TaxID=1517983 RepID=A0ABV0S7L8_9TELE